jgi:hypothetical protein
MALTVWWRRLVSAVRRSVRSGPRARRRNNSRPRQRPALERLEDRTLLTITAISSADPTMLSDTAAGNLQGPASVSSDGRYVVYTSTAANLAPNQVMPSESSANVFLYDRANGTTTLVSHAFSSATTAADGTSKNAVISANGNWIAYVSNSDNLVSGETLADDTYSLVVQGYTGGTFALAYGAQTVNIAYNATASTVASDLAGLAGGAGNVSVTGGNGEPFTITFTGALANGASSPLTADGSGLTGGGGQRQLCLPGGAQRVSVRSVLGFPLQRADRRHHPRQPCRLRSGDRLSDDRERGHQRHPHRGGGRPHQPGQPDHQRVDQQ